MRAIVLPDLCDAHGAVVRVAEPIFVPGEIVYADRNGGLLVAPRPLV